MKPSEPQIDCMGRADVTVIGPRPEDLLIHLSSLAATGYCLTEADVRPILPRIDAPVLLLLGDQGWDGSQQAMPADPSLQLMQRVLSDTETAVIAHTPST